jgi:arabinoxylan arabinofuranohydrolase
MDGIGSGEDAFIANPILPGLGVCDPHVHVFGGRAYLYATHDRSPENTGYAMDDWWIWSSGDLSHWRHECTISPESTYISEKSSHCWATDAAERNGRYYFYFSEKNLRTGVLEGKTPSGPWRDPLGRPLIGDGVVPVGAYDPCVFTDTEGDPWIVFGVWRFFLARLGEDMVSLASRPVEIEVIDPRGPYGPGRTDDKPFIHHRCGLYYLSWGCYWAISDKVRGPYRCMGSFFSEKEVSTLDRHGSFFQWKDRWYFICTDHSASGNPFFRDSVICPVSYGAGGELLPVAALPRLRVH